LKIRITSRFSVYLNLLEHPIHRWSTLAPGSVPKDVDEHFGMIPILFRKKKVDPNRKEESGSESE